MQIGQRQRTISKRRIKASKLMDRLHQHGMGEIQMSSTQIRAAEVFIKKVIPDLSAIEHSGEIAHRNVDELSDAELHEIAAGRGADPAEPQSGADEPPPVH